MSFDDKMNRQDYVLIFNLLDEEGRRKLNLIGNNTGLKQVLLNNETSIEEFQKLNVAKRISDIVDSGCQDCRVCDCYLSRKEFFDSILHTSK